MPTIIDAAINALFIMQVLLFIYVLLSFFPLAPNGIVAQIREILSRFIEPVLTFLRRYIPPMGRFDLSFFVLFLGLMILQSILGSFR